MTTDQRAELRRLAERATPGPWWNESGVLHAKNPGVWSEANKSCIHPASCPEPYWENAEPDQQRRDADFIAAANPSAVLALLDRADELEREVERLRQIEDKALCWDALVRENESLKAENAKLCNAYGS